MKIKDMPSEGRPRERFLERGPEALSDAELFAILLRTGSRNKIGEKGENVIDMSNRLIAEYGLNKLFDCSLKELQKIKGIGQSKAMQILAISEITKRISSKKENIKKISSAKDVFDLMHSKLKGKKQEEFWVVLLNSHNNVIKYELITKGILDASIAHPREIFRSAIRNSAKKMILVHNHPSGNPEPSQEDLDMTKRIIELGDQMDIKVLDHVILAGEEKFWSWKGKAKT